MNSTVATTHLFTCTLLAVSSGCGLVLDLERPTDDGGMDASTPDAGGTASDAGADAGMGDAGTDDAGTDDAGMDDAGMDDAGFSCGSAADCDDGNACSVDACTDNVCTHAVTVCPERNCMTFIGCDADGGCLYDTSAVDADGDTYNSAMCGGEDCDDDDPDVYPRADEVCDGHDQDCDGLADEGLPLTTTCYADLDGDGYGDDLVTQGVCGSTCPAGYVLAPGDCWDTAAVTTPPASDAHPEQLSYFAMSRSDGGESFDWDCDGTEEPEHTSTVSCGSDCMGTPGWIRDVPPCGESGMWATCAGVTPAGVCVHTVRTRIQRCR